jgi:hypothetical protein
MWDEWVGAYAPGPHQSFCPRFEKLSVLSDTIGYQPGYMY